MSIAQADNLRRITVAAQAEFSAVWDDQDAPAARKLKRFVEAADAELAAAAHAAGIWERSRRNDHYTTAIRAAVEMADEARLQLDGVRYTLDNFVANPSSHGRSAAIVITLNVNVANTAATTARLLVQLIRLASAGQASAVSGFGVFRRR